MEQITENQESHKLHQHTVSKRSCLSSSELLKPRFKVIAEYPRCPYSIGEIFNVTTDNMCVFFAKYPHLFRKLNWWENRTEEEMPKMVKSQANGSIYVIEKWDVKNNFGYVDFKNRRGCDLTAWKPKLGYVPFD